MTLRDGVINFVKTHNANLLDFLREATSFVGACPNTQWRTSYDATTVNDAWARGFLRISRSPGLVHPAGTGRSWFLRVTPQAHRLLDEV
jgi:hypothetical protein